LRLEVAKTNSFWARQELTWQEPTWQDGNPFIGRIKGWNFVYLFTALDTHFVGIGSAGPIRGIGVLSLFTPLQRLLLGDFVETSTGKADSRHLYINNRHSNKSQKLLNQHDAPSSVGLAQPRNRESVMGIVMVLWPITVRVGTISALSGLKPEIWAGMSAEMPMTSRKGCGARKHLFDRDPAALCLLIYNCLSALSRLPYLYNLFYSLHCI
jgi:hypothetical protein